jgi:hypothetical protein
MVRLQYKKQVFLCMGNFKGTFSELLEYFYWTFSEPNALFIIPAITPNEPLVNV